MELLTPEKPTSPTPKSIRKEAIDNLIEGLGMIEPAYSPEDQARLDDKNEEIARREREKPSEKSANETAKCLELLLAYYGEADSWFGEKHDPHISIASEYDDKIHHTDGIVYFTDLQGETRYFTIDATYAQNPSKKAIGITGKIKEGKLPTLKYPVNPDNPEEYTNQAVKAPNAILQIDPESVTKLINLHQKIHSLVSKKNKSKLEQEQLNRLRSDQEAAHDSVRGLVLHQLVEQFKLFEDLAKKANKEILDFFEPVNPQITHRNTTHRSKINQFADSVRAYHNTKIFLESALVQYKQYMLKKYPASIQQSFSKMKTQAQNLALEIQYPKTPPQNKN